MKKTLKRASSLVLCFLLTLAIASTVFAETEVSQTFDAGTTEDVSEETDEDLTPGSTECTTITIKTTVDEYGNVTESSTSEVTTVTDADGNTTTETTETSESEEESEEESTAISLKTLSSSEETTEAGTETTTAAQEVTLVSTEKSYSLELTATTTAVSSSNDTVKKIKVSRPKLTTTTTKTYSDGTVESSSETVTYSLTVKCYVRSVGWKKASLSSSGGSYSYTASKSTSGKFISAVRITPSDNLKAAMETAGITFYYRTTTEYFGELGWAKAGLCSGTIGNNCPMTGLELKVVTTSQAKKLSTENRYIYTPTVSYTTRYTGKTSYTSAKTNGSTSGSKSAGTSIGSIKIQLSGDYSVSGSIKYCVRTSKTNSSSSWSDWVKNYSKAGSQNSKLRAIKIKLTGDMAEYYNVYYRVYISGYGWLGWAENGEKAGISGLNLSISAIQIKIVPKWSSGPDTSEKCYRTSSSTKINMVSKAQKYSSTSKYLILVDTDACRVGIFTGEEGAWKLKYYWQCCVGKSSTPTVKGTFTVGYKTYSFGESKGYSCYYATQIYGSYLFHSVLYYPYTNTIKDGTMGKAVSHGCVRLTKAHAKWIYNNIPRGTKVYIY